MDWRSVKFDWNRARAFLVTAEEGSLSAAARALGMAQPTLGRQVDALEQELGVVLFERAGRGLVLTPSGLELLDHVRAMGEAAGRMSLTASGRAQDIEGNVCISASEVDCAFRLPPIIARLRREQPGILVEVIASNAVSDLIRREADIAIRNFRPTQPDLITRKVREIRAGLYASPEYLARIGNPKTPDDLNEAEFIGFDNTDALINALNTRGLKLTPRNFPVLTLDHLVQWEMVKSGIGIGIMPEDIADLEPRVRRVVSSMGAFTAEMWLTAHREVHTSRRVRLVYDLLVQELAER
jgi:DNA-binding transcriptional LysR family regulator